MTKICICGHFGGNKEFYDGQTIKTKNIYSALEEHYGKNEMSRLDTYNWKKKPIKFLFKCIKGLKSSENMIILPAHNGVKMFVPLFVFLNRFYHKKVFYVVIGGWLPELLKSRKKLTKRIRKLDRIFVETQFMKNKLHELKVDNVDIMPNFKYLNILNENDLSKIIELPLKLCTFSRVTKSKGIEDAISVVEIINKEHNKEICTLDIYGSIDKEYNDEFKQLMNNTPNAIEYKGVVEYNDSVNTLKNYDLLLFPTYYEGEGFAGTLLDAMASGLPIIASDWKYNNEIIKDGYNGYLYTTHKNEEMQEKVEYLIENIDIIKQMKINCMKEAEKYKPEEVIKILLKEI